MAEQREMTAGGWLDEFVEYLKLALDIVQLNPDAIDDASADDEAFSMGLLIIVLAGVAAAIGSMTGIGVVAFPLFTLMMAFIGAGIFHLLATVAFKGEGDFLSFFRPFSLAYITAWVNVVWVLNLVLGWLAAIWMLVVWAYCVERVYGLDRPRAIATVAIPVVAVFFLMAIFGAFLLSVALLLGLTQAG